MFAFTKEQLEAQVASILQGTPLQFEIKRTVTGLLLVEVSLPIGFALVDEALHNETVKNLPILGQFKPNNYQHMLVVKTDKPCGFDGFVFQFSPWKGDPSFWLDDELKKISALTALFRIPI